MMTTTTTGKAMTEDQMVGLVRNALLVAGQEMGAEGDHWPVIKSTIHTIMKDWEDLKIERNVSAEMKKHYNDIILDIEKNIDLCPSDLRPHASRMIIELRDMLEARFTPIDTDMVVVCDSEIPIHVKRAETIIRSLED